MGLFKKDNNDSVSKKLDINEQTIKAVFHSEINKDFVVRDFTFDGGTKGIICFIDGMVNSEIINNFILRPLLELKKDKINTDLPNTIISIIESHQVSELKDIESIKQSILMGDTAVFVDGCDTCFLCETKGFEKRSVSAPQTEGVLKGSYEGFTEVIKTNISLLRRIIKSSDLCSEYLNIGDVNNNLCAVMYVKGIANQEVIDNVKERIKSIKSDYVYGGGMLEQFIEDSPYSLFPTVLTTERPDRAATHLMDGRVIVIAEGTPFVLVVPITLSILLESPEGNHVRWQYGTFEKIIRTIAFIIAVLLPGFFIALTNFHSEMIPTDLLIAIANSREKVPFTLFAEVILMEVSFELIREAGIRIPGLIGNTIGIVGALILGQAAVQANIVSPVLVIIIAFTGLSNFAIPDFALASGIRTLQFLFIFAGSVMGFIGISLVIVWSISALTYRRSYGIPMLSMQALRWSSEGNNVFTQKPIWKQEIRPKQPQPQKPRKQPEISRPWTKKK